MARPDILIRLMQARLDHPSGHQRRGRHPRLGIFLRGRSTENVKDNVATGTFGAWEETGRNIHLALLGGALEERGLAAPSANSSTDDGLTLPSVESLEAALGAEPSHPLAPAARRIAAGHARSPFWPPAGTKSSIRGKQTCVLAQSFQRNIPLTVHPGIGYDIIANHPMFNGAAIGRAAEIDFRYLARRWRGWTAAWCLSVGSAIMGPQVFEKSLSCVNNLRLQAGRAVVRGHAIYVVDLQDGGRWDWTQGEPPKDNPAYYLRFCKSYSRMGGECAICNATTWASSTISCANWKPSQVGRAVPCPPNRFGEMPVPQ